MNASATAMAGPVGRARRRPRDWVVDTLLFLAAVVFGLLVIGGRLDASTPTPGWLLTADVMAGAVGCAGLWLRRRWPVGLALVLIALSTFSESVAGAMVLGLLNVAIHRPPRTRRPCSRSAWWPGSSMWWSGPSPGSRPCSCC